MAETQNECNALFEKLDKIGEGVIKVVLEGGAFMPERAHEDDAGLDLRTPYPAKIPAGSSAVIDTGVRMAIPKGYYGKLESKSGLNVKHGVVSLGGVIDSGYTGRIKVKLYNFGDAPFMLNTGDKCVQLIIIPCLTGREMQPLPVKELDGTERGTGGFGSTGR